jgi:hypothetical protein
MSKKWYAGIKHPRFTHCDIFSSDTIPTQSTHGKRYAFCLGGYKTQYQAIAMAMYYNYGIDTPQPGRRSTRFMHKAILPDGL